ncbi:MAG: ABC transporter permease, partial [Gammaproteobacteria bacterium]
MHIPYELFIGLRYTRANRRTGRRNGFISFISALSIAGIALGVAALITVLSVMNGFQKEVRDRMLSVLSDIEVFAGQAPLTDWQAVLDAAMKHPDVVAGAPYVSGQAMLTIEGSVRGVLVRGVDPALEPKVADFARHMQRGSLDALQPGSFGVAVG